MHVVFSIFLLLSKLFQGEICVAGSRVFVQEGIYDQVVEKLKQKANNWVIGDPFDPKVNQGPQVRSYNLNHMNIG